MQTHIRLTKLSLKIISSKFCYLHYANFLTLIRNGSHISVNSNINIPTQTHAYITIKFTVQDHK